MAVGDGVVVGVALDVGVGVADGIRVGVLVGGAVEVIALSTGAAVPTRPQAMSNGIANRIKDRKNRRTVWRIMVSRIVNRLGGCNHDFSYLV